jgi:NNP family nitrate/nitrite transporter-like MFS transporter
MSYLCVVTFGSFVGYSASFPVLISTQFPEYATAWFAALRTVVGSVSRPIGGWLSDKVGGARVTFWTFVVMGLRVGAVLFFLAFMVLFLTTGIDNGSTYRMIHSVFRTERVREAVHRGEGARTEAAPRPEGGFLWDRLRGRYRSFRGFPGSISLQVLDLHVR